MRLKRWEVVLKYIVEDYIESAEPVGSKTLLKNHKLPLKLQQIEINSY